MRRAEATVRLPGRVAEAEVLWYDRARWPAWVEGFGAIRSQTGEWPHAGATVVWDSTPGGRGRVVERATAYEARTGQTATVEDNQLRGTQRVAFTPREDEELELAVTLDYELKRGGPFMAFSDLFFIRRALRDSLRRTLMRFGRELAAERELAGGYPPAPLQQNDHR